MVVSPSQRIPESKENVRGGKGVVVFEDYIAKDLFPDHFRVFSEMVIEPGRSIGTHPHIDECEFYFMVEGEAVYDDNGTERIIKKGDITVCFDGESHGIENRSDKTVRALACVITK